PRDLVVVQAVAGAQRVQLGVPERLIGVDIADAGDDFLIEQQRLEARAPPEQQLAQQRGRKRIGERLDAVGAFERGQAQAIEQPRAAELARVVEEYLSPIVEQQHQV